MAVYGNALSVSDVEEHYAYGSRKGWVDIDLLDGTTLVEQIADDTLNDNEDSWYIENTVPAGTNYFVRVTRTDNVTLNDTSNSAFEITPPITEYFVNDSSLVDDEIMGTLGIAMSTGDDGNDGLHPTRAKASIRSVLETYDLDPGDKIFVNTGIYNLSTNIFLVAQDSGVEIIGPSVTGRMQPCRTAGTHPAAAMCLRWPAQMTSPWITCTSPVPNTESTLRTRPTVTI